MIELCPMTLKEANAYVEQHHRHHGPVVGHKFSIGLSDGEKIVGVAIVGRPVARHLDDGWTLEVNRLCTDGTRNACSMLYSAAWRAARAMGYKRLVTYILDTENGASLRASGWKCVGKAGGFRWTGKRRPASSCPAKKKEGGHDDDDFPEHSASLLVFSRCILPQACARSVACYYQCGTPAHMSVR